MKSPLCSIIVLNFNGRRHLNDCFESLRKINYPKDRYEVIMVDNGSTDDSVKFVKACFPWVRIMVLDKNYGFCEGNNKGIEKARGEYIVFLNNDTKVEKEWLAGLVEVANRSEKIGICGSKLIDQALGIIGEGSLNILSISDIRSRHNVEKECFFVSGSSLLIKKSVLRKLNYCWDPSFFTHFEDVDLCWRVWLCGYKVFYAPQSIALHKGRGTPSKESAMKFRHYRNKIWTFKKNSRFPLTQLLIVPVFIITVLMISYWVANGQWEQGTRVLEHIFSKKEKTPNLDRIPLKAQLKMFFMR